MPTKAQLMLAYGKFMAKVEKEVNMIYHDLPDGYTRSLSAHMLRARANYLEDLSSFCRRRIKFLKGEDYF